MNNSNKSLPTSGWRCALHDPVYFAREYLDFEPHYGQVAWLRGSTGFENALVTGNRWGKSDVQAVKLIHRSIFQIRRLKYDRPGHYRAVNVCITIDQAQIIYSKILAFLERNKKIKALVKKIRSTPLCDYHLPQRHRAHSPHQRQQGRIPAWQRLRLCQFR